MGTGLVVGVFDVLHFGHLKFLRSAHELCTSLIVGLQVWPELTKTDGTYQSFPQRCRRLELLRCVDQIVPYQAVEKLVHEVTFQQLILGEDQQHAGFKRALAYCLAAGLPVLRLPRTPAISSTALRQGCFGRFTAVLPPAR